MIPRFLLMTTGGGFNLGFDDDDGILADVMRPPFAVSFLIADLFSSSSLNII